MQPKTDLSNPAFGGGYLPYFYKAGLFLAYTSPGRAGHRPSSPAHPSYDFSSEPDFFGLSGHPQTVEQIVSRGYLSVPSGEPETALISDRQHTSWLGLDDVIHQIRHRQVLYQDNMDELDQSVCEANNAVFRQEAAQGAPADNRQQYAASKMIQGIYEQKRAERVSLWKDVSKLKLLLPESAQLYLAAYRKMKILDDSGDGSP